MNWISKTLIVSAFVMPQFVAQAQEDKALATDADSVARAIRHPHLRTDLSTKWQTYSETAQTDEYSEARWWQRFGDPLLDSLMEVGLARNYDVRMATRRIEVARNAVGVARAGYFPTVNAGISYNRSRGSGRVAGRTGTAGMTSYFDGQLSMSWELDVFGRITQQVSGSTAAVKVSRAERAGIKVSLEAQIAQAYVTLRVKQAQLQVATEHMASQMQVLKIAESRFDTGLASMLDVDQARTVYYNTTAMVPMLKSAIHTSINAIAVLLGEEPQSLYPVLEQPRPLPSYIQLVASGIPSDLLRRRPDVVKAEEQIAVEAANLGIAKKDWLPTLALNGSIGTTAHNAGDLFTNQSFTYSIAPTLSWTVFDGLSRKYNVASARENMQIAIDNYNYTVLTAFQETDNALSTYFANLQYISALDDLVSSSRDYDILSLDRYKSGLSAFINVANAQMSYLENQNTLIEAQGQALGALIDLYRALGGGWNDTMLR